MSHILILKTSLFSAEGQSSQLADKFIETRRASHPGDTVTVRDLARQPVPHLDAATFAAFGTPAEQRSPEQRQAVALSDALIDELRAADIVVLGLPLYNFGVPSTLKAWFDHVARAGVTFRYTATGPEGLLRGKQLFVLATRGGQYVGTEQDTQSGHVRDFFRLLGITEVAFIYAEGLARSGDVAQQTLAAARQSIARHAA